MKKIPIKILIAVYEIIGGILGVYLILINSSLLLSSGVNICITIFAFGVFLLSIIGGIFLLKNNNSGYRISCIAQIFQVPGLNIGVLSYIFISGFQLQIGTGNEGLLGNTYLGSLFDIRFFPSEQNFFFAVNIVPLSIIYFLQKQK